MLDVLMVTHAASEGAGTLADYLHSVGARIRTAALFAGEEVPSDSSGLDAVVVMGGPMNVDETHLYPFLAKEKEFLRRAIGSGTPVLGICLGAQLIARACGASVHKAAVPEVGWSDVVLTRRGRADRLFAGIDKQLRVLQWHEDTFELPPKAVLLAEGGECRHQAFRVGNAYGLQFHVEVNGDMLQDWFGHKSGQRDVVAEYCTIEPVLSTQARLLFRNFTRFAYTCVAK